MIVLGGKNAAPSRKGETIALVLSPISGHLHLISFKLSFGLQIAGKLCMFIADECTTVCASYIWPTNT